MDIKEIITKAVEGDKNSQEELVEYYYNDVFRFLLFLTHSTELAQDLCQDTFIKLLNNLNNIYEKQSLRPWLFKVAKNLFIDSTRKVKTDSLEDLNDIGVDFFANSRDKDLFIDAAKRFATLPIGERLALILVDLEEYSYEEAADFIGISIAALKAKLKKAREHFLSKD